MKVKSLATIRQRCLQPPLVVGGLWRVCVSVQSQEHRVTRSQPESYKWPSSYWHAHLETRNRKSRPSSRCPLVRPLLTAEDCAASDNIRFVRSVPDALLLMDESRFILLTCDRQERARRRRGDRLAACNIIQQYRSLGGSASRPVMGRPQCPLGITKTHCDQYRLW